MVIGRQYSDINLSLNINPVTGDITKNIGDAAVIGSISNILQTNHYERLFHPEKGANISKLLFEPLGPLSANALQKEIENTINNEEPRVTIYFISVKVNSDSNGYDITLEFWIENNSSPIAISTFLERL